MDDKSNHGVFYMAKKVAKVGIKKKEGWLYFVDKKGDVSAAQMSRKGRKKSKGKAKTMKVAKVGVKKEPGYLYFIDKQGDVSCAKMKRGRK